MDSGPPACRKSPMNHALTHVTLMTGHTSTASRAGVETVVIDVLADMTESGSYPIPTQDGFWVTLTLVRGGAVFTIFIRGESGQSEPLATSGLAWTEAAAAEVWPALARMHRDMAHLTKSAPAPAATMPTTLPWLGVVLLPHFGIHFKSATWLGDFEQCYAWAIMDQHG